MIVFQDVRFEYITPEGPLMALDGVSFSVAQGEHVAIVGPNGSGKSTLALLCDALRVPTSGRVCVDGLCSATEHETWSIRELVGIVFQDPDDQIVGTVVEDDVAFGPENLGVARSELRERVDEALAAVGLTGFDRREPHVLSGGEKQRVAIAGALALRPRYLVLDEPTAMLDAAARYQVAVVIDRLVTSGTGVLHITHDPTEIARAARVIALERGRMVYDGSPTELLGDADLVNRLGLEPAPVALLADALRNCGVHVPAGIVDAEGLVETLWP